MSDIHLDLDAELRRFVEREIAEGRFHSVGEIVEHALQLLEQRENRLAELRAIMDEVEGVRRTVPAPPPRDLDRAR